MAEEAKTSKNVDEVEDINLQSLSIKEGIRQAPVCIIVLGMAGSGKTTFTRALIENAHADYNPYVVNLDPACREVPYPAHIDIRDTVNFKEVMKQYGLGPNGGIVTSLNMFTTKIASFVELIRRAGERGHKWCIIDTPGQIEVFTWSSSGNIITESLATMFPTVIVYVMDVPRSACPSTFMSNMLYACSIVYKTHLPFLVVLNKIDLKDCGFIKEWMTNFEAYQDALEEQQCFVNNLSRSMSLTLDIFYENLKTCGVSSKTGQGFADLKNHVLECVAEYEKDFKPIYEKMRLKRLADQQEEVKPAANIEEAGVAVQLGLDMSEPTTGGNNIFLNAPTMVPQTEEMDSDDSEVDMKVETEEHSFKNFVEQHKAATQAKHAKLMEQQLKKPAPS